MIPVSAAAYKLFHQGTLALADVEANGIHIDMPYCKKQSKKLKKKITRLKDELMEIDEVKVWKRIYGKKFKLSSNPQLAKVIFDHMGVVPMKMTKGGKTPAVDKDALEGVDLPFVKKVVRLRQLLNARNTYLKGIMRETVNGYMHPFFSLNTAITYRSSSDHPNFQNIPVRIPEIKELIRRAFIPRPGRRLVEIDYKGIEVGVAACYHHDPKMIAYLNDKSKDLHRDMAAKCYMLKKKQVTKDTRYCGKNKFVFPEFYGDYYKSCAKSLWGAIPRMDLKTKDGVGLRSHLKSKGIIRYKNYVDHIERVEDWFWNDNFSVYSDWKDEHYENYQQRGYFDTLTGFRCQGFMKRNEVINYPVQGSAFHCLLLSLVRINRWLKKNKMNTCIIGQIHDSIVMDVDPAEYDEVMAKVQEITRDELRNTWKWIIVPLDIEIEAAGVDESWYTKKEVKIA